MPEPSAPSPEEAAVLQLPPRAIVLAAGRGERMRPLSDHTPKPLLPVHGEPLLAHHLRALARDGVEQAVINTAWLEAQFEPALGDGRRFGLQLSYSHEGERYGGALETAGGIATVLPWLCEAGRPVFWAVSGDIWAPDFVFDTALAARFAARPELLALLWLVPNPPYHPAGDFACGAALPDLAPGASLGRSSRSLGSTDRAGPADQTELATSCLTYANLALLKPGLFDGLAPGRRAPLGPLLHTAMQAGQVAVLPYAGRWANVGTPADLAALQGGGANPAT